MELKEKLKHQIFFSLIEVMQLRIDSVIVNLLFVVFNSIEDKLKKLFFGHILYA